MQITYYQFVSKPHCDIIIWSFKSGKVKYELRVTSSNPRVTSSNPRVRRLKTGAARLKAQVRRLKARAEAIKPRVT